MKIHSRTGAAVQLDDIQLDKPVDYPVAIHWTATGSLGATEERLAHDLVHPLEELLTVCGEHVDSALTLHLGDDAVANEVGAVGVEVVIGVGVEGDVDALALTLAVHRLLIAGILTPSSVGFLDAMCMVRDGEEQVCPGEFAKLIGSVEESTVTLNGLRTNVGDLGVEVGVSVSGDLEIPEALCSVELSLLGLGKTTPPRGERDLGRDDVGDELHLALDLEAREDGAVSLGLDRLVEGSDGLGDDGVGGVTVNHIVFPFFEVN